MAETKEKTEWAMAKNASLGDVYHAARPPHGVAWCDHRIKLEDGRFDERPTDGYVCKRCIALTH